ncbi:MAG: hypothetical protein NZM06_04760 [Chloroherpetonaceae bacterium]|nr:hypothetical protein [Chloroherpetonaceae bacterium]MDW8437832.1 hypothetical protein [Chloroherpetonaceae bacterium]
MQTAHQQSVLTQDEWKELRTQINELFDITFRYAELVARESDAIWDRDRPKFYKPASKSIDEAIAEYEVRLAAFEAERKKAYLEVYTKLKADSVDRVAIIEKLVTKLAQSQGVDFKSQ